MSAGWMELFQNLPTPSQMTIGRIGAKEARDNARKDATHAFGLEYNAQKEFAQHGIKWRVEDALRAGINPLAALGNPGISYSPIGISSGPPQDSLFSDLSDRMGQNVKRMINATSSMSQREEAFADLKLENAGLQNDMLRSQIAQINSQSNPPFPTINAKPHETTGRDPRSPQREYGDIPDVGWAKTSTGLAPVPSKDVKERIEDQIIPEMMWSLRNNVLPTFGGKKTKPPKDLLPKGATDWYYHPIHQEWRPDYKDGWTDKLKNRWNSVNKQLKERGY